MERIIKIFPSCALGAFLGATVALKVNHYFWWIGLLAGGLVGYLSYEFKKVLSAIPQAYRRISGWRPNKKFWKEYVLMVIALMSVVLTFEILLVVPLVIYLNDPSLISFTTILMLIMTSLLAIILTGYDESETLLNEIIKIFHPLSVFFYWLPKGIWWCTKRTPKMIMAIIRFSGRFFKTLFIMIHSDIRLLCGVDAALGAGIGYFAKSPIIGMFAGGIFGVINYVVVSRKILKIQIEI